MSTKIQKTGRPITLSNEIAQTLSDAWALSQTLSDADICDQVGITTGQLEGWLKRDIPATVCIDDKKQTAGLRQIRTRAKAGIKAGYLQKLHNIADQAETKGDTATASKIYMWLLEKQFPNDFGCRQQIDMNAGVKMTYDEAEIKKAYAKIRALQVASTTIQDDDDD